MSTILAATDEVGPTGRLADAGDVLICEVGSGVKDALDRSDNRPTVITVVDGEFLPHREPWLTDQAYCEEVWDLETA